MQMRTSTKATNTRFSEKYITCTITNTLIDNNEIRLVKTQGDNTTKAILFIHGAPGSSNAFYYYLEDKQLLKQASLYSVDRCGYGYSEFGSSISSIEQQAKLLSQLIDSCIFEKEIIVVGHSFGGPIAAYLSTLNTRITKLVMLAPANDPTHEKIFWISYFARWKLTKWMIPKTFQVAGDEKFAHQQALEEIEEIWSKIEIETVHFHGKKDALVPFENLQFTKERMNPTVFKEVIFDEENHFIPWTQQKTITLELLRLLE